MRGMENMEGRKMMGEKNSESKNKRRKNPAEKHLQQPGQRLRNAFLVHIQIKSLGGETTPGYMTLADNEKLPFPVEER